MLGSREMKGCETPWWSGGKKRKWAIKHSRRVLIVSHIGGDFVCFVQEFTADTSIFWNYIACKTFSAQLAAVQAAARSRFSSYCCMFISQNYAVRKQKSYGSMEMLLFVTQASGSQTRVVWKAETWRRLESLPFTWLDYPCDISWRSQGKMLLYKASADGGLVYTVLMGLLWCFCNINICGFTYCVNTGED